MENTLQQSSEANNAASFTAEDDDVFARISTRYDLLCDIFSFFIHRTWKRNVAKEIAAHPWAQLLDSASGTGDIVLRVVENLDPSSKQHIIASDLSPSMLGIAQRRLSNSPIPIEITCLNAHSMPAVQSNSIDVYSISLGLKICDRSKVFQEAYRVLRPGGTFISLEASNIPNRWIHRLYLKYMEAVMPILGWIATKGDASAYKYLLKGINDFPTAENLALELGAHGFEEARFRRLSLGIVAIHIANKPATATA